MSNNKIQEHSKTDQRDEYSNESLKIENDCIPEHIGIIMDGNGRWASKRGLSRSAGHKAGAEAVNAIVTGCVRLGVKHLTLYSFSTENWSRPKEEVTYIFDLVAEFLGKELPSLLKHDIKLQVFGDTSNVPFLTRKALDYAINKTKDNKTFNLNIALNYSGRDEIIMACRQLLKEGVSPDNLTSDKFASYLYSAGQPDPDFIIRTSGELRISNFMLFQVAYSEYYFTDTLWPDFREEDLMIAIKSFQGRNRRFGNIK